MKTILFTLDDYHTGGIVSFTRMHSSVLVKNGYKVVILARKSNETNLESIFPGCTIFEIPTFLRKNGLLGRILDFFDYFKYLNTIYSKFNVDVIHFSLVWSSIYSLFHFKTWRKNKIITFHGAYDLEKNSQRLDGRFTAKIKGFLRKALQTIVLNFSDKIIVLSKHSKRVLENHFSSKKLIKKTVLISGFINDEEIYQLHSVNKETNNQITLVNFGRAEPLKGIDTLLKAVRILLDKDYKIKLIVASPVFYLKKFDLLDLYEELNLFENVEFLHSLSDEQKLKILQKADLFIMPSRELETFGLTIIESLAKSVPVIGNNVGAIPEILSKVDKRLIFNLSEKSLSNKIESYIKLSKKEKNRIKQNSLKVIKSLYSRSALEKKVLSLY